MQWCSSSAAKQSKRSKAVGPYGTHNVLVVGVPQCDHALVESACQSPWIYIYTHKRNFVLWPVTAIKSGGDRPVLKYFLLHYSVILSL